VYVYTNSRVLNQKETFTNKASKKWYKQSVTSEDSDSDGPTDLSNVDIPEANMDSLFTNDKNT
jgi:hypothetical protein